MGGQKFEYDESGSTFFYFVLSFLALILVPATFYYWPRKRKEDPVRKAESCQCPNCINKQLIIEQSQPYKGVKNFFIKLAIILGWVLLGFLAYKVSQFDYEMSNFDPYDILGLPPGATQAEIKKSYRKQSLILHPDKETGDEKAFMRLTKAYQALTDDEARRNWEKYGNPDGPGAMSFGIALPSWIVEKENSVWVLGLYALVFMVALPTAVGMWWYRSIRFSGEQVLLDTTQMYFYFCHKTPSMPLKRALMILAASCEFDRRHNSEIIERITDNEEVPMLLRELPHLGEKNKEQPLCRAYSIKARALLHAHLARMRLPPALEADRRYVVARCPDLVLEMVNCVNQLIALAYARRIPRLPTIETIENCMKLSPMIVQGLWEYKSPLLQLPYITEDHLKYFTNRKKHIKSLLQLAQLPGEERRQVLRFLNDKQYEDLMKVLGNMPYIHFQVNTEVIDDENSTVVTAGAIVTVTVFLRRTNMKELFGDTTIKEKENINDDEDGGGGENGEKGENDKNDKDKDKKEAFKRPVWMKQAKRAPAKKTKKGSAKPTRPAPPTPPAATPTPPADANKHKEPKKKEDKEKEKEKDKDNDAGSDSEAESSDEERSGSSSEESAKCSGEDEDDQWDKFQKRIQKRERLEGRSKSSHPVHCPYFPQEKQEYWWCYICDRKSHTLLTAPAHVTALVDAHELQLRFTAPRWPGLYTLACCLRSDSYIGMDQQQDMKLDVKEAAAVPAEHPQWDLSESDSDNNDQGGNESEFTTDDEVEEE